MKTLSIGNILLDAPVVQAALSGYSDGPMRRLAREHGCPYTINEVVLDRFVAEGGRKMRRMLAIGADDHPVAGQLMGSEPVQFAEAAAELVDLGYDTIDINFGCPVRKVLGRCRGGFLLSTPDVACEIIRRVCDSVAGRVPVTLKMRRGTDETPESEKHFFTILDSAYELGCAAVTVHGRSVVQRYVGPSSWPFLAKVKDHVGDRALLGSGDLFTAVDCLRMLEQTNVDGVSIARGAIGNPFIFEEVRALLAGRPLPDAPSIAEQGAAIRRHMDLMVPVYGEKRASVLFRKFGVRYSELHPCHDEVKKAFVDVHGPEDFSRVIEHWYATSDRYPPVHRRERPGDLVAAGATMG